MGGGGGNHGKLTKPIKSLVNGNGIFVYEIQLAQLDAPSAAKKSVTIPGTSTEEKILCCRKPKREVGCSVLD